MTALPLSSDFTAAPVTEGAFKTAITDQRAYLAGLLGSDGTIATALAALGALGGGYVTKTATYSLTSADRGVVIDASNTWTLSLPTAASAGAGFMFGMRNSGSGTITVDPSGAELIDGGATLGFGPGAGSLIVSTGTAWITAGPKVQNSQSDTTGGALMATGAFGLGLNAINGIDAPGDDLDALSIQGFWRYGPATTGRPTNGGVVIHTNRSFGAATGAYMQLAISHVGDIYTRQLDAGTWSAWVQVLQEGADIGATTPAAATFTDITASGDLTLSGAVISGEEKTIADDAVGSFTLPENGGFVFVTADGGTGSPRPVFSALLYFDAGSTATCKANTGFATVGTQITTFTTTLSGTTGTDGEVSISANSGVLEIENRTGSPMNFRTVRM